MAQLLETAYDAAALPPELLQVLGSHLSSSELRSARLACKPWATALGVCMPAMTMSLPQQASANVFRQPLVLRSGQINSAQSTNYSAIPRAPAAMLRRAAARPSPFATKGGQALTAQPLEDLNPSSNAGELPSPFIQVAASLPPGMLSRMEHSPTVPVPSTHGRIGAAAAQPSALQWQGSGMIQSWSSLPSAGLRTCSSLQQLNLQLSGAPPTPQDLLDLSSLPNLTHLSFRQVELPSSASCQPVAEEEAALEAQQSGEEVTFDAHSGSSSSSNSSGSGSGGSTNSCGSSPSVWQLRSISDLANAAAAALEAFHISSPNAGSSSSSSSYASADTSSSRSSRSSSFDVDAAGLLSSLHASSVTSQSIYGSDAGDSRDDDYEDDIRANTLDQACSSSSSAGTGSADTVEGPNQQTKCVCCSMITLQHVEALAQLPCLSSLELQPNNGSWDAAATAALVQLTILTGLTKLSITWGSADAAAAGPISDAAAVQAAHGEQLPLQQCLAGLTQLKELELNGCPVVDVVLLQRMQQLRRLSAEALKVVNSDVLLKVQQQRGQQGDSSDAGAARPGARGDQEPADALPAGGPDQQQTQQAVRRRPKWATLPLLEQLEVTHPASDISTFLQGTQTPLLSRLGFVARGPSDFARLLGQHGKLKVLHLVFAEDEPWHPIAVVRLPTALPSLRSLTLEGRFWLPNSLIVALGVMEVPIEELCLTCKLAPPCLERLQHLKQLKKLALHHVPWNGHPAEGVVTKDVMLQLPAKMLPAQLRDLEISNGWILH